MKKEWENPSGQAVLWLSWLICVKSVLTYISNTLPLYHKPNYDHPQRTIELLTSSSSKPKYLESRKWILKKSINFAEPIIKVSCFFWASQRKCCILLDCPTFPILRSNFSLLISKPPNYLFWDFLFSVPVLSWFFSMLVLKKNSSVRTVQLTFRGHQAP